jgi:hypothetical protein
MLAPAVRAPRDKLQIPACGPAPLPGVWRPLHQLTLRPTSRCKALINSVAAGCGLHLWQDEGFC